MLTTAFQNLPAFMFASARLKLTIWYLFIIMSVSLVFSFAIYSGINLELNQFERLTVVRREVDFFGTRVQRTPAFDKGMISNARQKLILNLALINLGILVISGVSGYLLAGKTLKPIEDMVGEQKRFIADASHELRTPLTAMKTEIEVALRDKGLSLAQSRKLLQSNLEETNKMQSLSNYLLSLSRYESVGEKLPMSKFNLAEILKNVIEKLEPVAQAKKVKLNPDLKDSSVIGNEDSLNELFTILIDNAIKYSHPKGEVRIKVARSMVSIQDFGVGIKESELPHIFDRFYRADSSRSKSSVEGYGLGLAIAKSIVDLHNGRIQVKSSLGQGTTFIVTL